MKIKLDITDINRNYFFELVLFLYFIFVFAHESLPYVKFIFWFIILFYTVLNCFRIKRTVSRINFKIAFIWSVPFAIWVWLSQFWSTFPSAMIDSTINATLFRIVFVIMGIALYCNTKEKCIRLMTLFCVAVIYTLLVAIITSPFDTYGTNEFGGIVSLHRNNIGELASIVAFLAFYAYNTVQKKLKYLLILVFCIIGVLITGSRGALISFIFMYILYAIFSDGINNKIKRFLLILAILVAGLYFISVNQYLNEYFGERLYAVFSTSYHDASAEDRVFYILIGLEMISKKPILGWGPNNFSVYLNRFGGYGRAVYGHNNYIELWSGYGIVGLFLFYWIYVYILKLNWSKRHDALGKLVLILLFRFILCDIQSIVYTTYNLMFLLSILIACTNVMRIHQKEITR